MTTQVRCRRSRPCNDEYCRRGVRIGVDVTADGVADFPGPQASSEAGTLQLTR